MMLLSSKDWVSSLGQHLHDTVFCNKLVRVFSELSCTNEQDLLVFLKGYDFTFFLLLVGSHDFCSNIALQVQMGNA